MSQVWSTAKTVMGVVVTLAAILLIGFYWTLESERAIRSLLLPVAIGQRESTREISGQITERVEGYVHSAQMRQARCEESHAIPYAGSRASISKQARA